MRRFIPRPVENCHLTPADANVRLGYELPGSREWSVTMLPSRRARAVGILPSTVRTLTFRAQSGDGPKNSQPWRSQISATSRSLIDANLRPVRCCSSINPPALAGV
jgi:hypothetical protein